MAQAQKKPITIDELSIDLERDSFLRSLVRELSGVLEDVIGLDEASGFISVVGQAIGNQINNKYKNALKVSSLDRSHIPQILVDLKQRIQGDFYIIEETEDKIIFGNRECPFAEKVKDRQSLCMMTSNVFGTIAADNTGYAKVSLEKTIARGDEGCRIVVYFDTTEESEAAQGLQYFNNMD